MSDFLKDVLAADAPVEKELTIAGKVGKVFVKRISAAHREALLKGQTVVTKANEGATVEVDLAANEHSKHLMVLACICHEDGRAYFKNAAEVKGLDSYKVEALYALAAEVNNSEPLGKS